MFDLGGCEWIFKTIAILGVLRLIGLGTGGSRRDENDEITAELNKVIPPYQAEAQKNLSSRNPTYTAKAEYDALIRQIEHDGQEYRYK